MVFNVISQRDRITLIRKKAKDMKKKQDKDNLIREYQNAGSSKRQNARPSQTDSTYCP
jgi:hypothetical protein